MGSQAGLGSTCSTKRTNNRSTISSERVCRRRGMCNSMRTIRRRGSNLHIISRQLLETVEEKSDREEQKRCLFESKLQHLRNTITTLGSESGESRSRSQDKSRSSTYEQYVLANRKRKAGSQANESIGSNGDSYAADSVCAALETGQNWAKSQIKNSEVSNPEWQLKVKARTDSHRADEASRNEEESNTSSIIELDKGFSNLGMSPASSESNKCRQSLL